MFTPLAYTKTFAIMASVILALTVVPTLCYHLFRPMDWPRRTVRIIAAALDANADAIYPGYGFLSENANFAQSCADNDDVICWSLNGSCH